MSLENRDAWASDADWQQGYQWIVELQANLMNGCVDRIVEMQERTYRLLDAALNGTVYAVDTPATSTTLAVVSPAIPDVPDSTAKASVRDNLEEIRALLEANGTSEVGIEDVLNLILMALA